MRNTVLLLSVAMISVFGLGACQQPAANNNTAPNAANNSEVGNVPNSGGECTQGATDPAVAINSPAEAYSFLFEAVKKNDVDAIKSVSSKATRELAQFMSNSYKKSCADSYKNGFTESAMQEKMPETRDLRMEGEVAALEIKGPKGNWENVPFVKEGNGWKLGIGDLFFGKIKSPGKPQSIREQENANARGLNNVPMPGNANGNNFEAVPVPDEKIEKPLLKKRPGAANQ